MNVLAPRPSQVRRCPSPSRWRRRRRGRSCAGFLLRAGNIACTRFIWRMQQIGSTTAGRLTSSRARVCCRRCFRAAQSQQTRFLAHPPTPVLKNKYSTGSLPSAHWPEPHLQYQHVCAANKFNRPTLVMKSIHVSALAPEHLVYGNGVTERQMWPGPMPNTTQSHAHTHTHTHTHAHAHAHAHPTVSTTAHPTVCTTNATVGC